MNTLLVLHMASTIYQEQESCWRGLKDEKEEVYAK